MCPWVDIGEPERRRVAVMQEKHKMSTKLVGPNPEK